MGRFKDLKFYLGIISEYYFLKYKTGRFLFSVVWKIFLFFFSQLKIPELFGDRENILKLRRIAS